MSEIAYIEPIKQPISARVSVPGSKSLTNRGLIIAALAEGTTTLYGASNANDSVILIKLLKELGVDIKVTGDTIVINGNGGKLNPFRGELYVEDAGTVMRFLSALCSIVPGETTLRGTERMHQRPIHGLAEALKQFGVEITYLEDEGYPPIKINGTDIKGGKIYVDASISSQFVSALLMMTPILPADTEIICTGELVSLPYIDMTISVMKHFGVEVRHEKHQHYFIKGKQKYKACDYTIEGDASSASYMFALAAISGSTVEVLNLSSSSLQSDAGFPDILGRMGCTVSKGETIKVTGCRHLQAVEVNMADTPDTAQTLTVLAAFAKGETAITGLSTLEHKETMRLVALQTELHKMDIISHIDKKSIRIIGGVPNGKLINTYNDHRMAMAFAVAGARINDVSIESPEVVKKSFPTFWDTLKDMGIKVELR